eukprot:804118-Prymnesium_polylepis.1
MADALAVQQHATPTAGHALRTAQKPQRISVFGDSLQLPSPHVATPQWQCRTHTHISTNERVWQRDGA